jgi:hypothetical protein
MQIKKLAEFRNNILDFIFNYLKPQNEHLIENQLISVS